MKKTLLFLALLYSQLCLSQPCKPENIIKNPDYPSNYIKGHNELIQFIINNLDTNQCIIYKNSYRIKFVVDSDKSIKCIQINGKPFSEMKKDERSISDAVQKSSGWNAGKFKKICVPTYYSFVLKINIE